MRCRTMRPRLALAAALAALVCAAPAAADTTTTLAPPSRSPLVIPGTGVKRGDALRPGQLLLRRLVAVKQGERRTLRLTCPDGKVHAGLGLFDLTRIGFVARNRYPGKRTAVVEAFSLRGRDARGSLFALCVTPAR